MLDLKCNKQNVLHCSIFGNTGITTMQKGIVRFTYFTPNSYIVYPIFGPQIKNTLIFLFYIQVQI